MALPERTLRYIGAKMATARGTAPYQPPAIGDLLRRIDQALVARH